MNTAFVSPLKGKVGSQVVLCSSSTESIFTCNISSLSGPHIEASNGVVTLRTAPTDRSDRSDLGSSEQFRRIDRSGRGIGRSGRGINRG